jgi:predicted transglutaminase-like cysteine proteinase
MRFAQLAFVMALFAFSANAEGIEPFGLATVPAPQNPYAADWRKVQDDWAVEREILDRCRVERERCPSRAALELLAMIDAARARSGRARLGYINRAINLAVRPMKDLDNYGVPEVWKAPLAALANGAGDCTDYAIAKYFALGEVGVAAKIAAWSWSGPSRAGWISILCLPYARSSTGSSSTTGA